MSIVKLIAHTSQPELITTIAAKMCYSSGNLDEIIKSIKNNKNSIKNSISNILQNKHESVIEHAYFTFYIGNISRACMSQLTRHRIASFSVKSQRYVSEIDFNKNIIYPKSITQNLNLRIGYDKLIQNINNNYKQLLKFVPKEDARSVLPNSCSTQLIMSANARSLYNFFKLRCCYKAQDEIREVANKMLKECKIVAPLLFKNAGANCKYCTEKIKTEYCK